MPSGWETRIFIRPGARELIALLLWEPRCELAFVSTMKTKYCVPIAGRLLECTVPGVEWTLEWYGVAACWTCSTVQLHARVDVISQPIDAEQQKGLHKQGGKCSVKDFDRLCATLRECGWRWCTEHNTVLLHTERDSASHPQNIMWVPSWRPVEEGVEDPNPVDSELGRSVLTKLNGGAGVTQNIESGLTTLWGPYKYVTDREEAFYSLRCLWRDFEQAPFVGVNLEYQLEQVCLVQLASEQRVLVLDAIKLGDDTMRELLDQLVRDNFVCKVVSSYDYALVWFDWKFPSKRATASLTLRRMRSSSTVGGRTDSRPSRGSACTTCSTRSRHWTRRQTGSTGRSPSRCSPTRPPGSRYFCHSKPRSLTR